MSLRVSVQLRRFITPNMHVVLSLDHGSYDSLGYELAQRGNCALALRTCYKRSMDWDEILQVRASLRGDRQSQHY